MGKTLGCDTIQAPVLLTVYMSSRPPHLPPETIADDRYAIEGLVRLAEGRLFYLAHLVDDPSGGRFLLSARWDTGQFEAYEAFVALGLDHPGLVLPTDVFRREGVLYSVTPYQGEALLLDEAAPLPNGRLLSLGQRLAGVLAYLHTQGVVLSAVRRANLLISPDNTVQLFDLEVEETLDRPVPLDRSLEVIGELGTLLYKLCDLETTGVAGFLQQVAQGRVASLAALGRGLEARTPEWSILPGSGRISGLTDVGLIRQLNEDHWGWERLTDHARLYVVADGMGGHDCGELASQIAVESLCTIAKDFPLGEPRSEGELVTMMEEAFQSANNAVKDEAERRDSDMGTTLVAMLLLDDGRAFLGNVGDSRGYLHRNGELQQVTIDHSLVQKMVERGRITAEEARHHPHANILLRTVGTERDIDVDVHPVLLKGGDRIMICSDGLWGEVEDEDISTILNTHPDPRVASRELVRAAHHGGGKDNITLMIIGV